MVVRAIEAQAVQAGLSLSMPLSSAWGAARRYPEIPPQRQGCGRGGGVCCGVLRRRQDSALSMRVVLEHPVAVPQLDAV